MSLHHACHHARLVLVLVLLGCNQGSGSPDPPQIDGSMATVDAAVDAPPQTCSNLAGTWGITGTCGADLCTITQVGCAITQVTCTSGARSTSGTINGGQFSYTGTDGGGTPASCSGTFAGNALTGTCTRNSIDCSISGQR